MDPLKRDVEVKLLVGCTSEEKAVICNFHNESEYMAVTLLERVDCDLENGKEVG